MGDRLARRRPGCSPFSPPPYSSARVPRPLEKDGAPRWMWDRRYPFDVHGSAQGIVSFTKAARHDREFLPQAETVADWAIRNLYRKDRGDFAYRQGRLLKWDYSLMRWCNAWMGRALAELVQHTGSGRVEKDVVGT